MFEVDREGRCTRPQIARKRRRKRSPRKPLHWNSSFLSNFLLRLFENLGTMRGQVEHYLNSGGEFRWASACSGSECPHWIFQALLSVGAKMLFYHAYSAEISARKRQWILDNARPSVLFGHIFDITRAQAFCHATGVEVASSRAFRYATDLFIAGFSCKTVSALNPDNETRHKTITDFHGSTGLTWWGVVLALEQTRPASFILENVEGLMRHGLHLLVEAKLIALGYIVVWRLCNSTECGIPQNRPRIWFVGWRGTLVKDGISFKNRMAETMANLFQQHPMMNVEEFLFPEDHDAILNDVNACAPKCSRGSPGGKWVAKDTEMRAKKGGHRN